MTGLRDRCGYHTETAQSKSQTNWAVQKVDGVYPHEIPHQPFDQTSLKLAVDYPVSGLVLQVDYESFLSLRAADLEEMGLADREDIHQLISLITHLNMQHLSE